MRTFSRVFIFCATSFTARMRLIEEKEKEEDDDGFTEGNGLRVDS